MKQDPSAEETAAKEVVRLAAEQGLSPTGPDGLLKQFTKSVLETALNEEITEHLGHDVTSGCEEWGAAARTLSSSTPQRAWCYCAV